jgi:N-acetylneuraminic acid mutarotase
VAGRLPRPLRYAAAATDGRRLLVAGGTDGVRASRDVYSFDPASGRARRIARLPHPLAHTAGAVIGGTFFVLGGRGNGLATQRRDIWAVDPASGRVRRAGRLPVPLSDLSAVALGGRLLVVGGRDRAGGVHHEVLELAPR